MSRRPIDFLKQLANVIPIGAYVGSGTHRVVWHVGDQTEAGGHRNKPSAGRGDAPARPQNLVMIFKVSKGAGARPSV